MSNQNYSQSSSSNSKFNPIFIIIIGLIIFGIGVISTFNDMRYKSYSKKVVGEVEKISDETGRMYIYVKYEVNGKILVNTIDYYNDNIYVGEKITVYYDINNTNKIKYDTTRFGIIFIFLGIVFIGTSIWIYYKKSKI